MFPNWFSFPTVPKPLLNPNRSQTTFKSQTDYNINHFPKSVYNSHFSNFCNYFLAINQLGNYAPVFKFLQFYNSKQFESDFGWKDVEGGPYFLVSFRFLS